MVEFCLQGKFTCDVYGNVYRDDEVVKEHPDYDGYRAIYIQGVELPCHQIIAFIKYGNDAIQPKIVTRHLNGKQLDNSWDNIAIGTMKDNVLDIPAERRSQIRKNYWDTLTPEQRSERNKIGCAKISKEVQRQRGLKGSSMVKNRRGRFSKPLNNQESF